MTIISILQQVLLCRGHLIACNNSSHAAQLHAHHVKLCEHIGLFVLQALNSFKGSRKLASEASFGRSAAGICRFDKCMYDARYVT